MQSTTQLATLLRSLDLFHLLPDEEIHFLEQNMRPQLYERGDVLIRQGLPNEHIVLIESGLVSILIEGEGGTLVEATQLGTGAVLGEMSLLLDSLPTATVVAIVESQGWLLHHEAFRELLSRSLYLSQGVNRILSSRLSATTERLSSTQSAHINILMVDDDSLALLATEIAASVAWHCRERVLVVDCYPVGQSPLSHLETWSDPPLMGDEVSHHATAADVRMPLNGARLIRHSVKEGQVARGSDLLSIVARLRTLYSQILFIVPPNNPAATGTLLQQEGDFLMLTHVDRLHRIGWLLARPDVLAATGRGRLAVMGWPRRPTQGDERLMMDRHSWPIAALIHDPHRAEGIGRIARWLTRLRVGVAWGGGTARGWALAGIARALESLGVAMDVFAGTSAGALGAAVYGLSLDYSVAEERMRRVLPFLKRTTRVIPPLAVSRYSVFAASWWENLIRTFVEDHTFEDVLLPFGAVALDLQTGKQHVFTDGLLWPAIRASSAVPLIAPPMVINGRAYADGGVINAVPLDVARDLGADVLIGIDLTGAEQETEWGEGARPNMIGLLLRTITVAYNSAASRTIPLADVLIRPTLRGAAVYDVSVMDKFIDEGYEVTLAARNELRRALPWIE